MLQIKDLVFDAWGRRFFDGATVSLPVGAKVGLVGRNGVGKSTLFKVILGQLTAGSGEIGMPKAARIGSVARRYTGNPNPIITHGGLEIDRAAKSIRRDGKPVALTAREWALFDAFLARPGQLLSKSQLEEKLYAFDSEVESNTIEVHVSRLRKKLGNEVIDTERGLGYRLGVP